MIKFLKFLWKKCFGSMGDSRIKNTPTSIPVVIPQPRALHCENHTRFKKSCSSCLRVVGVR